MLIKWVLSYPTKLIMSLFLLFTLTHYISNTLLELTYPNGQNAIYILFTLTFNPGFWVGDWSMRWSAVD